MTIEKEVTDIDKRGKSEWEEIPQVQNFAGE